MAKESSARNLVPDDLVQTLAPDPLQHAPDCFAISGWLGRSGRPGLWRFYPTPELDEYIEIAEDDILYSQPIDKALSPLGGTVLMIKATANLQSIGATSVDARTAFLQGDITADFSTLGPAAALSLGGGTGLGNKDYTKGFWCGVSMFFSCATHVVRNPVCTTASGKLCGTRRFLP